MLYIVVLLSNRALTINYQLSTINYQLSTINYQLSTINYQLSTINYQLSTAMLSIAILVEENIFQLDRLIDVLIRQSEKIGAFQLLLVVNKAITENVQLAQILDKYKQKQAAIAIIEKENIERLEIDLSKQIKSQFLFLIKSNYLPQENWLKNLCQAFAQPEVNFLAGQITKQNQTEKELSYLQQWQEQTANIAIRLDYFQRVNILALLSCYDEPTDCYCRLLRELEDEVVYCPDAIVMK